MNKKNFLWIAVITLGILLLFSVLYQYSNNETADVKTPIITNSVAKIVNNTTNSTKELNKTNNTINQNTISIPLEKPPFID